MNKEKERLIERIEEMPDSYTAITVPKTWVNIERSARAQRNTD